MQVTDGWILGVTEKTCPVRIALHNGRGPVTLDPFSFVVIPGTDDVTLRNPAMKAFIAIFDSFGEGVSYECFVLHLTH